MQYLNDDMDELFRRAAKEYPLNTNSANWEKVKTALEQTPVAASSVKDKNNKRHLLWLLVMLPLGLICTRLEKGEGEMHRNHVVSRGLATGSIGKAEETSIAKPVRAREERVDLSSKTGTGVFSLPNSARDEAGTPEHSQTIAKGRLSANITSPGETSSNVATPIKENTEEPGYYRGQQDKNQLTQAQLPNNDVAANNSMIKNSDEEKETSLPAPITSTKPSQDRVKRFYAGIIGGLDVTSIKLQKVKGVGYDIGLLAGYEISRKWSIEAGLLSSEKAYYSKGRYLGKAQAYMPYGAKIIDAKGDCRMLEVPVTVRYRITEGKKGSWVASVGLSSYFMKQEDYDYAIWNQTTGQQEERSRYYNENSRHLAAAVQLSGGYQYKLGKTGTLRIEPFLKIPVGKVGIYELPLTSGGIHVGVTRKLF